jgi:tetratricopeptide (TPR) repeat protein
MRKEERHQIKRDDLRTALESAADYVAGNRRNVLVGAGVLAAAVLLAAAGRAWWGSRQAEEARRVGDLITAANATVVSNLDDLGNARPGQQNFTSTEERARKVLDLADAILKSGSSGTAAVTAQLYRGTALADLGRTDEAAKALDEAARLDPDGIVGGTARLRLARLREAQGKPADALPVYQALAEAKQGPMPREEGLLGVARCQEALGRHDEAAATYKKLLQDFPDSEYVSEAREKSGARS